MQVKVSSITVGLNYREHFDPDGLRELADSIASEGLLQPIVVRPAGSGFQVIGGERRLRAIRDLLGWSEVEVVVRDSDDTAAIVGNLVENMVRRDTKPLEEAHGLAHAIQVTGLDSGGLAARMGLSVDLVRRRLSLLNLCPDVAHWVETGGLPLNRAELLTGLDANRQRLALAVWEASPGMSLDRFRAVVYGYLDDMGADAMFDPDDFMAVQTWVLEVVEATEPEPVVLDATRETPLEVSDVATRLGVAPRTVHQWIARKVLTPAGRIGGAPYFWAEDVDAWAVETGRAIQGALA